METDARIDARDSARINSVCATETASNVLWCVNAFSFSFFFCTYQCLYRDIRWHRAATNAARPTASMATVNRPLARPTSVWDNAKMAILVISVTNDAQRFAMATHVMKVVARRARLDALERDATNVAIIVLRKDVID